MRNQSHHMTRRTSYRTRLQALLPASLAGTLAALALMTGFAFLAGVAGPAALARGKPLDWKAAEQALLRVDDHPVAEWNLYQAGKRDNRLLLQMGPRFLLIDVSAHQIFELDPSKIEHKGAGLRWDPDEHPDKPLETTAWLVKDVGGAYRFSARLVAENRVLDVQLPHPLDLRPIVPRRYG
jgi:hypothetical protein